MFLMIMFIFLGATTLPIFTKAKTKKSWTISSFI